MDTGPLVAFLNANDRHHGWALEVFSQVQAPVATCEAVLSEACFLLRRARGGREAVLQLLERGLVHVPFRLESECSAIGRLLGRYAEVPMSLADACLVRMSEQISGSILLTLDRDFKIYRKNGREVIPTRMPPGP